MIPPRGGASYPFPSPQITKDVPSFYGNYCTYLGTVLFLCCNFHRELLCYLQYFFLLISSQIQLRFNINVEVLKYISKRQFSEQSFFIFFLHIQLQVRQFGIFLCSEVINQMLGQLGYFHTLEENLKQLANSSQQLKHKLDEAFTPADQHYCTLEGQILTIIQEAQKAEIWAEDIISRISSSAFVPIILDDIQLKELFLGYQTLPSWFGVMLEEEYSSRRNEFNNKAAQMAKKHHLQEKIRGLGQQRARLTLFYERNNALSDAKVEQISLREESIELKNRVSHVKKSFMFFCSQVANILKIFVSELAGKSRSIRSNKASSPLPAQMDVNLKSNVYYTGSSPKEISREKPAQFFYRSPPKEKINRNDRFQPPVHDNSSRYNEWNSSKWLGDQSRTTNVQQKGFNFGNSNSNNSNAFYSHANKLDFNYKLQAKVNKGNFDAFNHSKIHQCRNHHVYSPDLHKHTCGISSLNLKRLGSAQNMRVHSPRNQHGSNFNFRAVIGSKF